MERPHAKFRRIIKLLVYYIKELEAAVDLSC